MLPPILLPLALAAEPPHHDAVVTLVPTEGTLQVVDRIDHVSPGATFTLHAGLDPRVQTKGWTLEPVDLQPDDAASPVPLERYRLVTQKKKPRTPVELTYGGPIQHPLQTQGEEYQRAFSETPGTIQDDGVYLARSTSWLPDFGPRLTYTLDARVPEGWSAVASGNPVEREDIEGFGWTSPHPTGEAHLVAAAWTHITAEVDTPSGTRGIDIYLREPDPGLAFRYEAATARYLTLYEGMLTPYPFERFALVENFWETGFGMPGFTLLGPEVIRMPWILTSSYPHEILHTWWGNSAMVDPDGGNWAEGLTAYMADHLFAAHRGQDAEYRRSTLKKFTDIAADQDFPLVDFLGRTSASTESVGYGKSLMFWHMVHRHIGSEAFLAGLSAFHEATAFQASGFADIEPFLSEASGEDLKPFFDAWTTTSGAIRLGVRDVKVEKEEQGHVLTAVLTQEQPVKPGWVPLRISTASGKRAMEVDVALDGAETAVRVDIPADRGQPMRLDVDPDFDVMRILDPMEVPPALTSVFGEDAATFVLPSKASDAEREAWKALAAGWARPGTPTLLEDDAVDAPPPGSWVLGWDNLHGPTIAERVAHTGATVDAKGLTWAGEAFDRGHAIVLVARADDVERAVGWVTAGRVEAIPGLARKLPHYTKYGLLAFAGTAPDNVAKAVWPAVRSPLTVNLTDAPLAEAQRAPARAPLAEMPPRFDADSLAETAAWLADPARQGRGMGSEGVAQAADYVVDALAAIGIEAERQSFTAVNPLNGEETELTNVVATLPGSGRPLPPVVVMAHLDHLGMGEIDARKGNEGLLHPGADDNASGVAVALDVLRYLASEPPRPRPITFVFTDGEEAGLLGATRFVTQHPDDPPFACVSLDTVGRLGDAGKLTIAGAETARELRFLFMGVGYTTGMTFGFAQPGANASDHAACHQVGVPGVQITTGPHADYHAPGDTLDKLDLEGLAAVADATLEAVAYLAERTDPLTVQLGDAATPPSGGARKASLGTMPDMTFGGPGVRVADVMPGSAALKAGLKAGDVLLAIDGQDIADLRGFSTLLKAMSPGDTVPVKVRRGTEVLELQATLTAR